MRNIPSLEINLDIIKDNYRKLTEVCTSLVGASVKADAYGLGATQVSKTLFNCGCNNFFVANLDEAISLRKVVKSANIFVLNGIFYGEEEYFEEFDLIPVISDLYQLKIIKDFKLQNRNSSAILSKNDSKLIASQKNISDNNSTTTQHIKQKQKIAIHFETGMNRFAMPQNQFEQILKDKTLIEGLDLCLVMSHLSSAGESENDENYRQLHKFNFLRKQFPQSIASLANSEGIFLGPEFHFDLTRPGAAIYGLRFNDKMSIFSNPVKLFTNIIQVKEVQKSESIGYNQTCRLKKDLMVGTIPVGYADGLSTTLSNIGYCFVNGYKANILGRVSMDFINIDLTNVPEHYRRIGQKVDIICDKLRPDEIAKFSNLLAYEVLTSLGTRHKRVYKEKKK